MIRNLVPTLYPVMLIMLLMWDWKFDAFRSNWFSLGFSPVTFSPINLTNTSQHEARKPVCIICSIPGKDFEARTYRALFDFIIAYLWDYRNYLQSTDFDKQNTCFFCFFLVDAWTRIIHLVKEESLIVEVSEYLFSIRNT